MAHKIDLFLDHDATTAMIEPKPMPPSIALSVMPSFSDLANSADELANKINPKKPILRVSPLNLMMLYPVIDASLY
jgi:hypothetical protein